MTNQPLMSIGMFSRATLLSIKALRAYHRQGLLEPALVDPETGYRAYDPGQLADAAVVRRLRNLDLPLSEVKQILDRRDPEITAKLLREHQALMESRLAETERIVNELQQAVANPIDATPVHVRTVQHQYAVGLHAQVAEADFAAFLGDAFGQLHQVLDAEGVQPAGADGALYPAQVEDADLQPVTAIIPLAGHVVLSTAGTGVSIVELPEEIHAVTVHRGPYTTVGDTYSGLGAWVVYNSKPTAGAIRESYVVSPADTNDPDQFRTEISWPIQGQVHENSTQ